MVMDVLLWWLVRLSVAAWAAAPASTAAARVDTVGYAAGDAETALTRADSNTAVAGEEATERVTNTTHRRHERRGEERRGEETGENESEEREAGRGNEDWIEHAVSKSV